MPYLLISTQIRLENGPTTVGDADADPELMASLDATLEKKLGNNFAEYTTRSPPRIVLDRLELRGYSVVGMSGVGQTCCWTLHKPTNT